MHKQPRLSQWKYCSELSGANKLFMAVLRVRTGHALKMHSYPRMLVTHAATVHKTCLTHQGLP